MVSVIIPTRNRAYTLERVFDSYVQECVDEIIVIDDDSEDDTQGIVSKIAKKHIDLLSVIYRKTKTKQGASYCRSLGVAIASGEYVLFGEDDAFLGKDYVIQLKSEIDSGSADIVSGRIVYMKDQETIEQADNRFGKGKLENKIFNMAMFSIEPDAYIDKEAIVPFTHALYMVKTELIKNIGFDCTYNKAHGYREETDSQIKAFVSGYVVKQIGSTKCYHLNRSEVSTGGQRVNRLVQYMFGVYYTSKLFDKYFQDLKGPLDIKYPKNVLLIIFSLAYFRKLFLSPIKKIPARIFGR